MKTLSIMAAMLVLALSATLVMADDAPATPAPNTGHKNNMNMVRGTITKIDGANVTVQPPTPKNAAAGAAAPDPKTFATDDKTVVTQGSMTGDKKAVSDLAVKQMVIVKLSDDGKTAVAIVISPTGNGHKKGGNAAGNN